MDHIKSTDRNWSVSDNQNVEEVQKLDQVKPEKEDEKNPLSEHLVDTPHPVSQEMAADQEEEQVTHETSFSPGISSVEEKYTNQEEHIDHDLSITDDLMNLRLQEDQPNKPGEEGITKLEEETFQEQGFEQEGDLAFHKTEAKADKENSKSELKENNSCQEGSHHETSLAAQMSDLDHRNEQQPTPVQGTKKEEDASPEMQVDENQAAENQAAENQASHVPELKSDTIQVVHSESNVQAAQPIMNVNEICSADQPVGIEQPAETISEEVKPEEIVGEKQNVPSNEDHSEEFKPAEVKDEQVNGSEEVENKEVKKEEIHTERVKQEESFIEDMKNKENQNEETNQKEEKREEAKQEEAKQEEAKQEEAKQEEAKQEEAKQEEAKQEEAKQEEAKQEEAKQEEAKQEEAKQEEAKQEEAKQEEAKQEEAKQEEAKQEEAKQEEAKQEDNNQKVNKEEDHIGEVLTASIGVLVEEPECTKSSQLNESAVAVNPEALGMMCSSPPNQLPVSPISPSARTEITPPGDMLHHIKNIQFNDKKVGIVTQNENGPCPLVAILNVLLLRRQITLPAHSEIVSAAKLMEYIGDAMLKSVPKNLSGEARLNYEQNMDDAMAVLPKLQTGLDVNVKFTGVRDFEYTPECIIFDLLRIPLFHGWLVDPQTPEVVSAVGQAGYNQLVEKVISQKCSNDEDAVMEALVIENFLERSASQLTYHGLSELTVSMEDDEIGVLFRNNHFSTIYKHQKELLQLVTDQGFLGEPNVVWETLGSIDGDGQFVDSHFRTVPPKPEHVAGGSSPNTSAQLTAEQQIDHDFLVALSLQEEQQQEQPPALPDEVIGDVGEDVAKSLAEDEKSTQELLDLELARQLQQEEERQAAEAETAEREAGSASPQQQQQASGSRLSPQSSASKKRDNCTFL